MEPVTITITKASIEVGKKIYDAAKKIEKVADTSMQMKNVAESEGKDQLKAMSRLASRSAELTQKGAGVGLDAKIEKTSPSERSSMDVDLNKSLEDLTFDESIPLGKTDVKPVGDVFNEDIPTLRETDDKLVGDGFMDEIPTSDGKLKDEFVEKMRDSSADIPQLKGDFICDDGIQDNPILKGDFVEYRGRPDMENANLISDESAKLEGIPTESEESIDVPENKQPGLTDAQKQEIKEKTGWSDQILSYIGSMDEASIYINAGLEEGTVDGRPALLRTDIDWSDYSIRRNTWLRDSSQQSLKDYDKWAEYNNADLIGEGYPPRDSNGDPYELHHIGQRPDSPLAVLTRSEHMENGNNTILHKVGKESEIDRGEFDKEKAAFWQAYYKDFSEAELEKIYDQHE